MNRLRHSRSLYGAAVALRDLHSLFLGWRAGTFSQHGEDRFVLEHFGDRRGLYVDIGASHPWRISNTFLLYLSGWRGVTVEPIRRLGRLHRRWRPRDLLLPVAAGLSSGTVEFFEMTPSVLSTSRREIAEGYVAAGHALLYEAYEVEVLPVNRILDRAAELGPIDFLSIDIEGMDVEVVQRLDFAKFNPAMICIEFNTEKDKRILLNTFNAAGYTRVRELGCNLVASRADA